MLPHTHSRLGILGPVPLAHDPGPGAPAGSVLRDLLEEVAVRVEEERDLRGEIVDGHPAPGHDRVAVGDAVLQGQGHLLGGIGAGVAEVRAGDGDGVEPGHLGGTELDRVADEAQ